MHPKARLCWIFDSHTGRLARARQHTPSTKEHITEVFLTAVLYPSSIQGMFYHFLGKQPKEQRVLTAKVVQVCGDTNWEMRV